MRFDRWPGRLKSPFGWWVRVTLVDRTELEGDHAEYTHDAREMSFADDQKPAPLWDSLLHEVQHMVFRASFGSNGMDALVSRIRRDRNFEGKDLEEEIVRRTTPKLLRVLRENFGFGPEL